MGYIQLLSSTKQVLSQRIGTEEQIEFFKNKVWFVKENFSVIFINKSELAQPCGFFSPVNKKDTVILYSLFKDEDDSIYDPRKEPKSNESLLIIKAEDLENKNISSLIKQDCWNAYVNGEYSGTSEY